MQSISTFQENVIGGALFMTPSMHLEIKRWNDLQAMADWSDIGIWHGKLVLRQKGTTYISAFTWSARAQYAGVFDDSTKYWSLKREEKQIPDQNLQQEWNETR